MDTDLEGQQREAFGLRFSLVKELTAEQKLDWSELDLATLEEIWRGEEGMAVSPPVVVRVRAADRPGNVGRER